MTDNAPRIDWTRDEHILALELYLRRTSSLPGKEHPEVLELSQFLIEMAGKLRLTVGKKYRNPNGVSMKLQNFKRCDPAYAHAGKSGLPHGSEGEQIIWDEFSKDIDALKAAAVEIRSRFR